MRLKWKFWRWFCFFALCASVSSNLSAQAAQGLHAIGIAGTFTQPLFVTAPAGDFNRIFVVQQNGEIRIFHLDTGLLNATPFLTVSNILVGGEQGLLGLAFDPNYATNGKFYVNCIAPGGAFNAGITQIRQYQVSADPDIADTTPTNIVTVLAFDQPQNNHNGGWIGFSPRASDDHNLYIASGDGGNANDFGPGHIEPGGNAQNTTTLLGKMLRIHVDPATGTYTIPVNNPYASSTDPNVKKEIWLLGLRNPFRDSFDRANGRMFIGDVGQNTREEVDVQQPTSPGGGENYGWRDREGTIQNPAYPTPTASPTPNRGWIDPIIDYPRTTGRTVIGGCIYRGALFPALRGTYVFGDYLGPNNGTSRIFTLNYDGATASNFQDITSQLFPYPVTNANVNLVNVSSFGEDAAGELYVADIGSGVVSKISPMLVSAASRKTHAGAPFDISLPLTGTPGVECRSGDPSMIFRFAFPLSSVGGRSITGGIGSVSSSMIDTSDARNFVVNLAGVVNAQYVTVTLTNVTDVITNTSASVSVTMGVLLGDTTGNGVVNSSDIAETQSQSGQSVTASNCREDVTVSGQINSSDVSLVQAQSGTGLPAAPSGQSPPVPNKKRSARSTSSSPTPNFRN